MSDHVSNDVPTAAYLAFEDGRAWDDERPTRAELAADERSYEPGSSTVNPVLREYDERQARAKAQAQRQQREGGR